MLSTVISFSIIMILELITGGECLLIVLHLMMHTVHRSVWQQ